MRANVSMIQIARIKYYETMEIEMKTLRERRDEYNVHVSFILGKRNRDQWKPNRHEGKKKSQNMCAEN